jgi:hypothetical protein
MAFKPGGRQGLIKLAEALGLPTDNLQSITVRAAFGELTTITVERCALTEQVEALTDLLAGPGEFVVIRDRSASYHVTERHLNGDKKVWEGGSLAVAMEQGLRSARGGDSLSVDLWHEGARLAIWYANGELLVRPDQNGLFVRSRWKD